MQISSPGGPISFSFVAVLILSAGIVMPAYAGMGSPGNAGVGTGRSVGPAGPGAEQGRVDKGGSDRTAAMAANAPAAELFKASHDVRQDKSLEITKTGTEPATNTGLKAQSRARKGTKRAMPFRKIERLARKGNLYAKWRLARMHEKRTLFPKNKAKAFKLYNEIFHAYRNGDLYSSRTRFIQETLISVAGYYRTGLPSAGVKKNPKRAFSILKHVALYGHPRAQYLLGQMKLRGEGTKPNRKQGMRWLNLAAQKKNAAAQAELGRIYASQKSRKADRAKGLMWLGLARGNEKDTSLRKKVSDLYESIMVKANQDERERAESMTLGWQQRYGGVR